MRAVGGTDLSLHENLPSPFALEQGLGWSPAVELPHVRTQALTALGCRTRPRGARRP
jgi:hypothetical protein